MSLGASELFTLSELVHHYCSFLRFKHLPNIHFFHFSDFKRSRRSDEANGRHSENEVEPELIGASHQPISIL